jgi:sugar lactone lactonase YvrE
VRYEPVQRDAGGPQVPAVTLTGIGHPTALAFDASGALWVSDLESNRIIMKYGPTKLAASGAPAPDVTINALANSLETPTGIVFDADGRLWVANSSWRTLVAFTPAQLATGGAVVPAIVITPSSRSVSIPTGFAFVGARVLWVVSGDGLLARYNRPLLAASGEPVASASLRVGAHVVFWSVAFWPKVRGCR